MCIEKVFSEQSPEAIAIELVGLQDLQSYLDLQKPQVKKILQVNKFSANTHEFCIIYNETGEIEKVVVGYKDRVDIWSLAKLPMLLPEATYQINDNQDTFKNVSLELGWALAGYQFTRYKKSKRQPAKICIRDNQNATQLKHIVESIYLIRDLINTPAEDMTPTALAEQALQLAGKYQGKCQVIVGAELLAQNFPTIHRVGRASVGDSEPRLIDLQWGDPSAKKLTLVGKGVCFDTGGLDLKPSSNMLLMKKDMGGAAHVLGLANLIMAEGLPIHLRVLIPAVENSIAGNAMRPSDIITTRKGLTVEVGNTDAEGRLVLSDALAYACEAKPDLILDFATLTGAHHAALGPAIPAILTKNRELAGCIQRMSEDCNDLIWPLPMHQPYRYYMDSSIADLNNSGRFPYAGCITAGLFLAEFVEPETTWAHFDLMAYNPDSQPGRPVGGDAQGLRAVFEYLKTEF